MTAGEFSIAMTTSMETQLRAHLDKGPRQEDLTLAVWRPSNGDRRETAILTRAIWPAAGERLLQGNVSFTTDYVQRALSDVGPGDGLALLHSHLGPGWQGMSDDDVVAERDRLAGPVFGRTGLPIVGLTSGTDGSWSGRRWLRSAPGRYEREWARNVRSVGQRLRVTFHPIDQTSEAGDKQVATVSVWGDAHQSALVRSRVGIVGLGSVGSLVAECLARIGIQRYVLIDMDRLEMRNLDRTAGATLCDAERGLSKVEVAERNIRRVGTGPNLEIATIEESILTSRALQAALDCDVLFSCVDRPRPRHLLNAMSYAHLIPVVDGGIFALTENGRFVHADWRIHTVGPERACLVCLGAVDPGDIALDIDGKLDAPDYIKNLGDSDRLLSRRNVYPFSMSVAAHEVLQFVGCVTGLQGIGGIGPQHYHAYPGSMEVSSQPQCIEGCDYSRLTATAADLSPNLID